jgi:hypothetical protein
MDNLILFNRSVPVTREAIHRLEVEIGRLPQVSLKVDHYWAPGVYVRTMHIPAGVAAVGHIHRYPCVSIVQKGHILLASAHTGARYLMAPHTFETPAGAKRAVYALTDTLFTTVHSNPDNSRDVDALESFLIAQDYSFLESDLCPSVQ